MFSILLNLVNMYMDPSTCDNFRLFFVVNMAGVMYDTSCSCMVIIRQAPVMVIIRQAPVMVIIRQAPVMVIIRQAPVMVIIRQAPVALSFVAHCNGMCYPLYAVFQYYNIIQRGGAHLLSL